MLPLTLAGRDVAAQAQTGTGKTAAYLVTIFTKLLTAPAPEPRVPRSLIIAPTRELVVQVAADAEKLGRHTGLVTEAVFGGMDYREQRDELLHGVDLLVGTPGRLLDYLRQGVTSLRHVEVFVVDEADRMFDMGFVDDLREITRRMPPPSKRQTMFYTATLSARVLALGYNEMRNPAEIVVNPEEITPDRLEQALYHVGAREKFSLLLGLLAQEGCSRTMIFVNTREEARRLVERLERHGYDARQSHRLGDPAPAPEGALRLQGRDAADPGGDRRRLARSSHRGRLARDQLRPAAGPGGLRPPGRPHRPRGRRGQGDLPGVRELRLLAAVDREAARRQHPGQVRGRRDVQAGAAAAAAAGAPPPRCAAACAVRRAAVRRATVPGAAARRTGVRARGFPAAREEAAPPPAAQARRRAGRHPSPRRGLTLARARPVARRGARE